MLILGGDLDLASAGHFERVLEEHRRTREAVVVQLNGLEFMDSTGLRLLLSAQADARRDGWSLKVDRDVSPSVARLIELTGVTALLEWRS